MWLNKVELRKIDGQHFSAVFWATYLFDIGHDTATLASLDDADCLDLVPLFILQELATVLRDLHYGKAADADGMVAEMLKYSNILLQKCLLNICNSMLASGSLETSWQHTLFTMLRKPGDSSPPNNWRPIAVLKIICKIFSPFFDALLQQGVPRSYCTLCCGNFTKDRRAQCMGVKGSPLNAE